MISYCAIIPFIVPYMIGKHVVFGRINKSDNIQITHFNVSRTLQGGFFARDQTKVTDSKFPLIKDQGEKHNSHFFPQLSDKRVEKIFVTAGVTALITTICYRFISRWIQYQLYDKYIREDAPGIADVLGHVLYKKIHDDQQLNRSSLPRTMISSVFSSLEKIGWLKGLLKLNIIRVPIGEAIEEETVTALYFHSSNVDKLLRNQGFMDFTPNLKKIYESMKNSGRKFQVVYINLDKNHLDAMDHFMEMPWYALPFGDKKRILSLCKLYDITSVPSVVLVDSSGKIVEDRALCVMLNKPNDYPWKVSSIIDLIPEFFLNGNNQHVSKSSLKGKMIGLYFGAGWTKTNKDFNSKLLEYYKAVNDKVDGKFEIIYVSNDKNSEQFEKELYDNNSAWLSVDFEDEKSRLLLQHYLRVQTLPSLILIDPSGNIITHDGAFYVETDRTADNLPYKSYLYGGGRPKVEDVAVNIDGFARYPVVIVFSDGASQKEKEDIESHLNEAALEHSNNRIGRELKFFISKENSKRANAIKSICGIRKSDKPEMVILDLLGQSVYYDPKISEITEDSILGFIKNFYKGSLKKRPVSIP